MEACPKAGVGWQLADAFKFSRAKVTHSFLAPLRCSSHPLRQLRTSRVCLRPAFKAGSSTDRCRRPICLRSKAALHSNDAPAVPRPWRRVLLTRTQSGRCRRSMVAAMDEPASPAEISELDFYGSGSCRKLLLQDDVTAVEARERLKKARREGQRACGNVSIFPRQHLAFQAWDARGEAQRESEMCLAEEVGESGKRRVMLGALASALSRMQARPPGRRHFYEVIRENRPCHLYLDLEYKRAFNEGRDGDAMTGRVVRLMLEEMERRFGVQVPPDSCVYELDSSTPDKFSRHVIVRVPGAAFRDNAHVGALAAAALARAASERGGEGVGEEGSRGAGVGEPGASPASETSTPSCERPTPTPAPTPAPTTSASPPPHPRRAPFPPDLAVCADAGATTCFVDMGVYTRNRTFRLAGSSKFKKDAVLRVTGRYAGARLQRWVVKKDGAGSGFDPCEGRGPCLEVLRATMASAVEEAALPGARLRVLEMEGAGRRVAAGAGCGGLARGADGVGIPIAMGEGGEVAARGVGPSPFPRVDAFVSEVASQHGVPCSVSGWSLSADASHATLTLDVQGGRFCHHVGRHHRSNRVYYAVALRRGTWSQRCHDSDCRGFRSPEMPLGSKALREAWAWVETLDFLRDVDSEGVQLQSAQLDARKRPRADALSAVEAAGWSDDLLAQALELG